MEIIELESTERVVRVRFDGIVYRRYPQAKRSSDRNYFRAGPGDVRKGRGYLHRDVWIAANGPIPNGHEVDHASGDRLDNTLANLQLLPVAEHKEKHREEQSERTRGRFLARTPEQVAGMQAAAAEWHRSEEGREWHRRHATRVSAGIPLVSQRCQRCGSEYEVKKHRRDHSLYCSNKCKAAARRASGVDDEDRVCQCGTVFRINKYAKTKSCKPSCVRGKSSQKCQKCGAVFFAPPSVGRRFCSIPCAHAKGSRQRAGGVQSDG